MPEYLLSNAHMPLKSQYLHAFALPSLTGFISMLPSAILPASLSMFLRFASMRSVIRVSSRLCPFLSVAELLSMTFSALLSPLYRPEYLDSSSIFFSKVSTSTPPNTSSSAANPMPSSVYLILSPIAVTSHAGLSKV